MKKYIAILTLTLVMSCDDFLDVKPTGTLIPTTVEDFDGLLNEVKIGAGSGSGEYANGSWNNMMFMDPDFWMPGGHYSNIWDPASRKQYQWDEHPYDLQASDADWNARYQYISVYNQIIHEVDDAPLGLVPESMRGLIKGEALAQRAMEFFLLINEYAPHYSSSIKDLTEKGIPMPLTSGDLQAQLPRTSVGTFYEQIETDLLMALALFEANQAPAINAAANFRPGKASIKALLAEIYLYMGDWANAEKYADESLALYTHLFDFSTMEYSRPGSPWWGFEPAEELRWETDQKWVTWNRLFTRNFYDPAHLYHPDLLAIINQTTDLRFFWFSGEYTYYDYQTSTGPDVVYVREYFASNAGCTVPRTILTSAEAKARSGDGRGAIDRLNELAAFRYTTVGSTFSYTDDAAALQEVKDERRRELHASGNNLIDLKRYHAYGETIPTVTRVIDNVGTITLEPGSDKYVVPIPRIVSNANPNLR